MSTEALIQAGLQDLIQAMSEFATADVVINDYGLLDQSTAGAPYVIIGSSHNFTSRRDTTTPTTTWNIPIMLVEAFDDWKTTYDNFTTRRQAIIDMMNTTDSRSADSIAGVTIDEVRSEGPIEGWFDPYLPAEDLKTAIPLFIFQRMIADVEDYGA